MNKLGPIATACATASFALAQPSAAVAGSIGTIRSAYLSGQAQQTCKLYKEKYISVGVMSKEYVDMWFDYLIDIKYKLQPRDAYLQVHYRISESGMIRTGRGGDQTCQKMWNRVLETSPI